MLRVYMYVMYIYISNIYIYQILYIYLYEYKILDICTISRVRQHTAAKKRKHRIHKENLALVVRLDSNDQILSRCISIRFMRLARARTFWAGGCRKATQIARHIDLLAQRTLQASHCVYDRGFNTLHKTTG